MPVTRQPNWELIANLGDAHPLDYGGYFVYRDTTGVYCEEAEKLFVEDENDYAIKWTAYRFSLDRCKVVGPYLVPFTYDATWVHPVSSYDEWFHKHIHSVASFVGQTVEELRDCLCSEDPVRRALAYEAIYDYHGWVNADGYPVQFADKKEVEARYEV